MMSFDGGSALRTRYGTPKRVASRGALAAVGRTDVDPEDVVAFLYPSREAALAFARCNRVERAYSTFGPVLTDGGWLGVIDLRPALAALQAHTGWS